MGKKVQAKGKKLPQAPLGRAPTEKAKKNPLFEKRTRNFRIGGDIQPKRDLTRFVRWPQYIRLQRQKRILLQRLKVPPTIAQFAHTADKNQFSTLAKLLKKYQPETRKQKKERLASMAAATEKGESVNSKAPSVIKYGINHVVDLVENKKAKLVVIAHDVDPIELVMFLPALCKKKEVPYMVVKGKARLGTFVHKKTCTALCLTQVDKGDIKDLEQVVESAKASFNDNADVRRHWGGGIMGVKSQHVERRRKAMLEKELAKKSGLAI